MARAPIGGLDDDAGSERAARAAERSSREDFRWRASVFAVSRGRGRGEIGKKIRVDADDRKDGPYLHHANADVAAALRAAFCDCLDLLIKYPAILVDRTYVQNPILRGGRFFSARSKVLCNRLQNVAIDFAVFDEVG